MGLSTGNFATDFAIAIGVAAAGTIAALILFCVLAQCGPKLCGFRRKDERWLEGRRPPCLTVIHQYSTTERERFANTIVDEIPLRRAAPVNDKTGLF
ncbi:hypothetical protein F4678DRAFT_467572 [Xylaria arbuscula]|nr:hypothetical protein F4678DRAFT_467572 [Xylaria arbuscula]